ncbi:MAG TPA: PilZ domain-containing protein [Spirochaetia bacterium]|nr:PilZ domain-containing protein [Spirochaetia bacterium]
MENEQRRHPRVSSYAKALLVEGHVPGYIRDLSLSGCQVSFMLPVKAQAGDLITVQVIAEHDPSIPPFRVRLRVKRLIQDPPWHSLGTEIEPPLDPSEQRAFEALVTYYVGARAAE